MTQPTKADLRAAALARRDALDPAARIEAALVLAETFPLDLIPVAGKVVSGFLPIQSEIDVRPLMDRLRLAGARLALPAFPDRKGPMIFRELIRGADLVPMGFGTYGPGPEAAEVFPEVLITPLAAFDARGHRIGYGKGHYDRALARLDEMGRRIAVGVAFACQAVDAVPHEPHDRGLDFLLTETGFRTF
ncbi:5-formyltetrahydrofolate cyclo-ligase [Phreatobacter sp.]|uniref:5-formyltetrahydrofolate cyclo-ligase n=1 Tax=Phreatobacter sp. TaxID=1966341 RepID=UPI0022C566C1|nr:5-formyltetrahydrofolate cyclo-ligase [Phreatobacter sp.]MCZ8313929.1 5-formyltetrahydrofolate cyclo-ligase [Phreatobacter sp.]